MLSTNATSSVQKRRQQHRRQQTLAVPILAPHHPAHPRRTQSTRNAHRRGLSLDQSPSVINSPVVFRQLRQQQDQSQDQQQDQDQDQDQDRRPGSSPVRIHLDTNTGHPKDTQQQHFMQETQQQSLAQPGFQAQDFQSHLQQKLQGQQMPPTHVAAPTPTHPSQQQALEQLQHHVEWYNKNFGSPAEPSMPFDFNAAANAAAAFARSTGLAQSQQGMQQPMPHGIPPQAMTPVSQAQPRTVPNTPQQYNPQSWQSPPPTNAKQVRSQSFQFDVNPMPATVNAGQVLDIEPMASFNQDAFNLASDPSYASSTYTASISDPMSPGRQRAANAMPTVFEESINSLVMQQADELLLQAGHAASDDFNSPNFVIGGGNFGLSPKDALLEGLGPNVNATIIDTGVPVDEIDRYISEQDPVTKLFYCLWHDDGEQCDKWHKRKENARSHVQGHLGDRQFLCNDCGKTFVRQHDMKRHAAIHNPERPHRCPCGSRFARHDALTRHRQRGMCKGALPGFERSEEDKPKRGRPKKKDRPDQETRSSKAQRARRMDRENAAAEADSALGGAYHSSSSAASERSLPMTPPDTSDFDADAFISMAQGSGATAGDSVQFTVAPAAWNDTPPTSPMPVGCAAMLVSKNEFDVEGEFVGTIISPAMLSHQPSSPLLANSASSALPRSEFSHPSPAASNTGNKSNTNTNTGTTASYASSSSFHGGSSPLDAYSHGFDGGDFNFGAVDSEPNVAGSSANCPQSDFFSDAFSPSESSGGSDIGRRPRGLLDFEEEDEEDEEDEELFGGRQRKHEVIFGEFSAERDREVSASGFWALEQFVSSH